MTTNIWPAKDTAEFLDYSIDWTARLSGDTITGSTWTINYAAGTALSVQSFTTTTTKTFVAGGTLGQSAIYTNTVTTAGGRTMDWQVYLPISAHDNTLVVERSRTVLDVITKAMLHIGAIASGETPNANETQDGLDAFNDVVETWNTENMSIYGSASASVSAIAGQALYTVGAGAQWNTSRPVSDIIGGFYTLNGVDFPLGTWTQAEYDACPNKNVQGIPERIVYINSWPTGTAYLWPIPSNTTSITIQANLLLAYADAGSNLVNLPPAYFRALCYAVAVELTPQYGGAIDVSAQARSTMAKIKRANRTQPIARFDPTLSGGGLPYPQRGY